MGRSFVCIAALLYSEDTIPKSHLLNPLIDQGLSCRRLPIPFEIGMALGTQPAAVVMTEAAFQRLVTGSIQLAKIILEKRTSVPGKLIGGDGALASLEGRGEHAKVQLGCDLQHHPAAIPGLDGGGSLLDRPPAGTHAIAQADFTAAWLGWRVFLLQGSLRPVFFS